MKFCTWSALLQGVPQGSALGSIVFNIYLHDHFYLTEMTNWNDTTFYEYDKDLNTLINRLEHDPALAVEWFENNFMKLNQGKCHLLVSGQKHKTVWAKVGETKVWESNKQKLLVVLIDRNRNFDKYVILFPMKWLSVSFPLHGSIKLTDTCRESYPICSSSSVLNGTVPFWEEITCPPVSSRNLLFWDDSDFKVRYFWIFKLGHTF